MTIQGTRLSVKTRTRVPMLQADHKNFLDLETWEESFARDCNVHQDGCQTLCPMRETQRYLDTEFTCDGRWVFFTEEVKGIESVISLPCPHCSPDYIYPLQRAEIERRKEEAKERAKNRANDEMFGPKQKRLQ